MKRIIVPKDTTNDVISSITIVNSQYRRTILCTTTKELTSKLSKVKSSNVWAYGIDVKHNGDETGDVIVQFKARNGGPGDIYIYYDVPIRVYQRWVSAPSKGHYFWQYIRDRFNYSKLTGDRKGKLAGAVN